MSARWYKRCGADFIHGTMKLTLEEKGAYSLCLDLIYDRGGPIPDDARWLSGICGVSIRKWNAIRARLLELGKLAAGHDMLSNARADLELVSAALSSRERAESGAKGGRKRAENVVDRSNVNDLAQAEPKREEKIREEVEEKVEAAPQLRARSQPVSEAVHVWNEAARAVGWPLALKADGNRGRNISGRLKENGLDGWRAAITRARQSPYLSQAPPPTWFTLDWLAGATNFLKVIEGNYDRNRSDNAKPSGWAAARDFNLARHPG